MGDGGSGSADSYIGSVISLTSKSEIRYEGILYTVDTENSNIALQNVRSFGTEGRKKEGPQITASDKVYEYIIFRGSDIKDLQVKSSPPVQAPSQPHSDPAIISLQAPYSQSPLMPPVYRSALGISADQNSSLSFPGVPAAAFRNGVPALYQPAPAMGPWGPLLPPPGANGTGLPMPMYWPGPGFYRTQTGQAHVQQQHPLPHSIPLPPLQPQPLIQPLGQALLPTVSASTSSFPLQPLNDASEYPAASVTAAASPSYPVAMSFGTAVTSATSVVLSSVASTSASLTSLPQGISAIITPASKIPRRESGLVHPSQLQSQYSNTIGTTTSSLTINYNSKVASPLQKTSSGQQHASGIGSVIDKPPISNVQVHKQEQKLAESLQSASQPTLSTSLSTQHQPPSQPLLPLPTASAHQRYMHQGNGTVSHSHHIRRGRGRGRASLVGHHTQQFMEEFDFTAMNEKFNKDEVWGELGKGDTREKVLDDDEDCGDGDVEDTVLDSTSALNKPVYVKDDFFDSLSCDARYRGEGRAERTKFSEQRKIDTETFGSFPTRSRGGRGIRSISHRGGYRGGYYGGHSTGGKGYAQGRGHGAMPSSNAM